MLKRITIDMVATALLSLATIAVIIVGISRFLPSFGTYKIIIAVGSTNGEALTLMKAVKAVAERYDPRLEISFLETAGSVDSLNRLERNEAQMAATEADIIAGPSARSVA